MLWCFRHNLFQDVKFSSANVFAKKEGKSWLWAAGSRLCRFLALWVSVGDLLSPGPLKNKQFIGDLRENREVLNFPEFLSCWWCHNSSSPVPGRRHKRVMHYYMQKMPHWVQLVHSDRASPWALRQEAQSRLEGLTGSQVGSMGLIFIGDQL